MQTKDEMEPGVYDSGEEIAGAGAAVGGEWIETPGSTGTASSRCPDRSSGDAIAPDRMQLPRAAARDRRAPPTFSCTGARAESRTLSRPQLLERLPEAEGGALLPGRARAAERASVIIKKVVAPPSQSSVR